MGHSDGGSWEIYGNALFSCRHGADYQRVPARVHGDWGIEGFTADGLLYQCYAPTEPLSTTDLHGKLRNKVTEDIGKLLKNAEAIVGLITPNPVKRWVLVTPRVENKAILQHAKVKEKLVTDAAVPGIATEFVIRIFTDADFAVEKRQLGEAASMHFPELSPTSDEDVAQFAAAEDLPVEALDAKIRKIEMITTEDEVRTLRAEFLRLLVDGESADGQLRRLHPTLWDDWSRGREATRRTLLMTQLTNTDVPSVRLRKVQDELKDVAAGPTANLPPGVAGQLAVGTVARWLLDCPLDFNAAQADA